MQRAAPKVVEHWVPTSRSRRVNGLGGHGIGENHRGLITQVTTCTTVSDTVGAEKEIDRIALAILQKALAEERIALAVERCRAYIWKPRQCRVTSLIEPCALTKLLRALSNPARSEIAPKRRAARLARSEST